MSEAADQQQGQADFGGAAPHDGVTAGTLLRQAREACGAHIMALAAALKVPVAKLEALEADDYAALSDPVFVRGLASSACRALRVDPAPVLARLPQSRAPQLVTHEAGINAPFRSAHKAQRAAAGENRSRPIIYGVVALLLGALVLILLPHIKEAVASFQAGRADRAAASAGPAPAEAAAPAAAAIVENVDRKDVAGVAAAPGTPALPATPGAPVQPQPQAPAGTAAPVQVAPATVAGQPPAVTTPAPAESVAAPLLTFTATGESWIKVTDAEGRVVFQKVLATGESASASGSLPLSVVVGRAGATTVQVRGKPFDLAPLARDNVARFQVK
ncbi:helix-turn-helix domain-containing protein [Xylophilus sp.]|uniref:helix-turn-helix domain-containing protein n=1 Tax=Xylophilus sp. TaxID=2653893 RepID=UPI0013B93F50|nr:helix-turn-helix domain-containing protein [Xylophilus sp.]KAF1046526.1 MAG: Cytoskeleton protein RodZ [Xylophilus sp.]